jgi:uncharacterized membrane protein
MATASRETLSRFESQQLPKTRLDSVDLLRGLVMVIMALDHTREFFTYVRTTPENLATANLAYFLTRWITHFCAPVFFFLAGTGAFLAASKGKKIGDVAAFLAKRGIWLVLLEFTLVDFGFSFAPGMIIAGVFYSIGICMIILALLVRLPIRWIAVIGVGTAVFHHLLDRVQPESFGRFATVWMLLHKPGFIAIKMPKYFFINVYVIIPWFAVMAAGYAFGKLLLKPQHERRQWLFGIGAAMTALFVLLRLTNWYGNPPADAALIPFSAGPYVPQPTFVGSLMHFLNVCKYPPSFQFLLMTLGPALMLMAWFDRMDLDAARNWLWRKVVIYGRVPLFYYILHIWIIHMLAIVIATLNGQSQKWLWNGAGFVGPGRTDHYGYGLAFVYLMWGVVVVLLYPLCVWYGRYKQTHRQWWLRYV